MGVEWSLGEVDYQQVKVPLTTMSDYYRSKGFKIEGVTLGYKIIGVFQENPEYDDPDFYNKYPNASRGTYAGTKDGKNMYEYTDKDTVDHLRVNLRKINEKNNL